MIRNLRNLRIKIENWLHKKWFQYKYDDNVMICEECPYQKDEEIETCGFIAEHCEALYWKWDE
jgi:hypothetical protein